MIVDGSNGTLRVEYLADGSPDCPLIRFFGLNGAGFARLRQVAQALSEDRSVRCDLADDSGFILVNMSRLILSNDEASGARISSIGAFEWSLKPDDWQTVAMLLEPLIDLAQDEIGFQWLDEASVSAGLPVLASRSQDGQW